MRISEQIDLNKIELPQDPIFIVGFPRSGTTLLQALLATQDTVHSFPETHFFDIISKVIQVDKDGNIKKACIDKVLEQIRRFMPPEVLSDTVNSVRLMSQRRVIGKRDIFQLMVLWNLKATCERNIESVRWCEKTPDHAYHLEEILGMYPKARFVNVIRHPLAAIYSFSRKFPWERNTALELVAQRWVKSIDSYEIFRRRHPDKIWPLKYESLVQRPVEILEDICGSLRISFDKEGIKRHGEIRAKMLLPWEEWKSEAPVGIVRNANELFRKQMRVRDILRVQRMTKKKMKNYGYRVLYRELQVLYNGMANVSEKVLRRPLSELRLVAS